MGVNRIERDNIICNLENGGAEDVVYDFHKMRFEFRIPIEEVRLKVAVPQNEFDSFFRTKRHQPSHGLEMKVFRLNWFSLQ